MEPLLLSRKQLINNLVVDSNIFNFGNAAFLNFQIHVVFIGVVALSTCSGNV